MVVAAIIAFTQEGMDLVENGAQELVNSDVPVTLVQTIDGDTIKVKMSSGKIETVRYLLIDTPESKKPGMCIQPFAKEAFKRNNELVRSGNITLEFEQGNKMDSYGRLLAYVYVNGESVQEFLLKEGYARVAYVMEPSYIYIDLFKGDEQLAKESKLNIWSKKGFVSTRGFVGCITNE